MTETVQNVTFQSTLQLKMQVLSLLGMEQIFQLLGDSDVQIIMKTLGLLRNLLSNPEVSNLDVSLIRNKPLTKIMHNLFFNISTIRTRNKGITYWTV